MPSSPTLTGSGDYAQAFGGKRATEPPNHSRSLTDFTRKKIMTKFVSRFVKDESGATAIEYGLIAALIAVVIIGAVQLVGTNLGLTFGKISAELG